MKLSEPLAVEVRRHFGEPVVDGAQQTEYRGADHDVVEVGDDEEGAPEDHIENRRGEKDSRNPSDDEEDDRPDGE